MAAEERDTPFRREALEHHARGRAAGREPLRDPRWLRWLPLPLVVMLALAVLFAARVRVARVGRVPAGAEAGTAGTPEDTEPLLSALWAQVRGERR